jgi:predicted transcriptional regulator
MSPLSHTVLVTLRDRYDATEEPVAADTVAELCGEAQADVIPVLRSLCGTDFVVKTDDGYRPTVTAREFLKLDVEVEDVVAVDVVDG